VGDLIPCQPVCGAITQPAKCRTILLGHDVFVERTDYHEEVITACLKALHQALEGGPLE